MWWRLQWSRWMGGVPLSVWFLTYSSLLSSSPPQCVVTVEKGKCIFTMVVVIFFRIRWFIWKGPRTFSDFDYPFDSLNMSIFGLLFWKYSKRDSLNYCSAMVCLLNSELPGTMSLALIYGSTVRRACGAWRRKHWSIFELIKINTHSSTGMRQSTVILICEKKNDINWRFSYKFWWDTFGFEKA